MSTKIVGKSQAMARGSVDFTRFRTQMQGRPKNYVSVGVVGHYDLNPAFARIESNKILVEVTLVPGGEEVVAELSADAQGGGWGLYLPLCIGCRVVVAFPDGEEDPIITRRLTDREFPFPEDVAGLPTGGLPAGLKSVAAPQWAFMRTPEGALYALETGEGGDIVIHSGASVKVHVSPGQAIHLTGRTHIGSDWTEAPTGASTGPAGEIVPGIPSIPHVPPPHVAAPPPSAPQVAIPGTPDTGVLRIRDFSQSDQTVDPTFWTWLNALHVTLIPLVTAWNTVATGGGGPLIVPQGGALPFLSTLPVPLVINSTARSSSRNTCAD